MTYRGKNWFKIFLTYTLHFTDRWCSWCAVDHVHSFYQVGINEFKSPENCCHSNYRHFINDFLSQDRLCSSVYESTQNIILCVMQTRRTKINKIMHVPKIKINKIMLPVSSSGFSYQVQNIRIEKKINILSEWNLNSDCQLRRLSLGSEHQFQKTGIKNYP